jgi:predicted hotdog family 3-hydroxylacyl-ACP dehydratase
MQWIDALTGCTANTATATVCFTAEHFAVADGAVLETALVESVAQAVAAALGHRAQASGEANRAANGMLGAVSNFRIHAQPPMGKTLLIEMRELRRFGPMLLVAGVVSCLGQPIASGELTLYA